MNKKRHTYLLLFLSFVLGLFGFGSAAFFIYDDYFQYQDWAEVAAKPLEGKIDMRMESTSNRFHTALEYQYEFQGQTHKYSHFRAFNDYTYAKELIDDFNNLSSDNLYCKVDPTSPEFSHLLWKGIVKTEWYYWLFILVICSFSIMCFFRALVGPKNDDQSQVAHEVEFKRLPPAVKVSASLLLISLGVFGGYLGWLNWWIPQSKMMEKDNWIETPCKIVYSELSSIYKSGYKSQSYKAYKPDIFYSYEIDGITYHSNRYDFDLTSDAATTDKERTQVIIDGYKPGTQSICYVSSSDPKEAVLQKKFDKVYYHFFIAFALIVAGILGVVLLILTIIRKSNNPSQKTMSYDKTFLSKYDLLIQRGCNPLPDSTQGIYYGVYNATAFKNLNEFGKFTQSMSSMTQWWYQNGNLDDALEWYVPSENETLLIHSQATHKGNFREWLHSLGFIPAETSALPDFDGKFYYYGNKDEFGITGQGKDGKYYDIFISLRL